MRMLIPDLAALALLPVLAVQGRQVRRRTPRLPEASGERSGMAGSAQGSLLRLLAVGESPVAGVGVANQQESITGQLAEALAVRTGRPVAWQAFGQNGATVSDAISGIVGQVPHSPVDVLLVAFGVNDTVAFRRHGQWLRDMQVLLAALRDRCSPTVVLLSGVPPMQDFPALPQPLRWVLGMKASTLECGLEELARSVDGVCHIPLRIGGDPSMAAEDGYHPSAKGCREWARLLAEAYMRNAQ